jgi:thioredoxin-related protein
MKAFLISIILVCSVAISHAQDIKWYNFNEVEKLQKEKPKKIFMDVFTDWCGWCKKMDATTFTNPTIIKLMNRYFYAVKFDAEGIDVYTYKGTTYKKPNEVKRTPNDFATMLMNGKMSYPTTVYMDESLNSLGPVPGYLDPKTMEKVLTFFGENIYLKQSWADFEKTFVGEIK